MSKEIKINYVWNEETFLEASRATYDFELKHSSKRFLGWFFIAMTQFGVVAALKKDAFALLLISTLLVIYWYALRWPLRRYMIKKSFVARTSEEHIFVMRASEEGLVVDENLLKWNEIREAVSLEKGFLLFYSDAFIYIPKSAFVNFDEKDKFSHLLKAQLENYTKEF